MSILVALQGPVVYRYATSGGITFGGLATSNRLAVWSASGGVVFGGTAGLTRIVTAVGAGGIGFAGAGTVQRVAITAGSGGILFGGAAGTAFVSIAVVGGAGGEPPRVWRQPVVRVERVPRPPRRFAYQARGGIRFGGAADTGVDRRPWRIPVEPVPYEARGGLTFGGAAPVSVRRVFVAPIAPSRMGFAGAADAWLDHRLAELLQDDAEVLALVGLEEEYAY